MIIAFRPHQQASGQLLNMYISEVADFNIKMINALHFIGVWQVKDLVILKKRDLMKAPGIGKQAISLVTAFLTCNQLSDSMLFNYTDQDTLTV